LEETTAYLPSLTLRQVSDLKSSIGLDWLEGLLCTSHLSCQNQAKKQAEKRMQQNY